MLKLYFEHDGTVKLDGENVWDEHVWKCWESQRLKVSVKVF